MLQLQIENCNKDNAESIVDFLEETGAVSVTMLDQHDDPILEPELGTMPLWPCVVISALYAEEINLDFIKSFLSEKYQNLNYTLEALPDNDWEKVCLDNFKPKQIGDKLLICPSWLPSNQQNTAVLTLDPGLAFGTGSHETTELCLAWLEQASLANKTILDFGCGSGILSLAALKLGAKYVYAIDIDDQALIATKNNAAVNAITDSQIKIAKPEMIKVQVDIIVANILLNTLISLKKTFLESLVPNGELVVSGILINQIEELVQAFSPELILQSRKQGSEWAMLVFKC